MMFTKLCGLALAAALVVSAPALATPHNTDARRNGASTVVRSTPVLSLDADQIEDYLVPVGVYVPEARLAVDSYQVVYRTVDVTGRPTTASAFVVVPRSTDRRLPPAVWLHGTQSYRLDAPSVSDCCDRAAGVLFAALGYVTVVPDYLGLGASPGTHPYFHSATLVSAAVDALRATREFVGRQGHTIDGDVSVAGFSQGANTSMLLARALQNGVDRHFGLDAVAPISGAYDLFGTEWPAALDGDVNPAAATYYLAYVTVAWNRIYHLYDDESEVFQHPYAGRVAALFDGNHTIEEAQDALPSSPAELLQPSYAEKLRHPTGSLARAAQINDDACRGWTPAAPVRMFAAHTDPEAVYANSLRCRALLRGTDVTLTDVGEADHSTSLMRSVPQVARWFAARH